MLAYIALWPRPVFDRLLETICNALPPASFLLLLLGLPALHKMVPRSASVGFQLAELLHAGTCELATQHQMLSCTNNMPADARVLITSTAPAWRLSAWC